MRNMRNMRSKKIINAFSLAEMMVVLLIVAIVAAATAPMVSKKMMRDAASGESPWIYTGTAGTISYNPAGGNRSAIIGSVSYNAGDSGPKYPRLVLAANGTNSPAFAFANSSGNYEGQLIYDTSTNNVGLTDVSLGKNSTAFGLNQVAVAGSNCTGTTLFGYRAVAGNFAAAIGYNATANSNNSIALGSTANAIGVYATAIGSKSSSNAYSVAVGGYSVKASATNSTAVGGFATYASAEWTVALGSSANASANNSTALGCSATASGVRSTALGRGATASGTDSVAIGCGANALGTNTVAIGYGANSGSLTKTIVLGNGHLVYIPGPLDVTGSITCINLSQSSDGRLKNIGKEYTAGLAEIRKLNPFCYTFKSDKEKTPRVGIIAQDLKKVFPDAVTKGSDGYLVIRMEDMFYAVINAIKELDQKITEIVKNITNISEIIENQNKTILELQTALEKQSETISALEKQNAVFEKQCAAFEKRSAAFAKQNTAISALEKQNANLEKRIKVLENKK